MKLKILLLSLLITIPVFANLDKTTNTSEKSKLEYAKSKVTNVIELAEGGDAESQLKLGMMLTKGVWLKKDKIKAIEWWHKSAVQDNIKAQLLLGTVYLAGERAEKDVEKSDYWFNKAIESDSDMIIVVNKMKSLITEREKKY